MVHVLLEHISGHCKEKLIGKSQDGFTQDKNPLRTLCQVQAPFDQLEQVVLGLDYFLMYFPN